MAYQPHCFYSATTPSRSKSTVSQSQRTRLPVPRDSVSRSRPSVYMPLEDLVEDVMNDREEMSDNEGDLDDPGVDCLHTADQRVYTRSSSPSHADERVYTRPPSHADQLMTMMQQQQAQLQKVLDGQQAMELRQSVMDTKLASLQEQILSQHTNASPSSSSDGKRKRVVTRTLSVRIL